MALNSRVPKKQGFLYSLYRKKLQYHLFDTWAVKFFYLNGNTFAYFNKGLVRYSQDEKIPKQMIQLKNSILEGIFEKDDLYVITLRTEDKEDPFTLGSEFKPEIESWKDELLRAIDLANKIDSVTPESPSSADKYILEDPPSYLLDAYRLLNKHMQSDKTEWHAVLIKDKAIIKKNKSCTQTTYKITISIENANISLALNAITVFLYIVFRRLLHMA